MKTIFVISGTSGEYEERTYWNVCATNSKERAEEILSKLNELLIFNNAFEEKIKQFKSSYDEDHKEEKSICPKRPSVPEQLFNGSLKNKNSLNKIKDDTIQSIDDWKIKVEQFYQDDKIYQDNAEIALNSWKKVNYNPPDHLLEVRSYCESYPFINDVSYSYHEISIL